MTYDQVHLLHDRVLIRLAPAEPPVSRGGIELFDWMPPPVTLGRVVDVGPECRDVAPGDFVQFSPEAGDDIDLFPTPHLIIRERLIATRIERNP